MAQQSYPIVEQPVTAEQWSTMAQGDGDGIIDRGNWPFWITSPSSVTDTVTVVPSRYKSRSGPTTGVQAGEAQLSGFYFRITANESLKIPPVAAKTRYWIALQYDPLRGTDPAGPIKLGVFAGDLDRSQGKTYLVLWALTRSPNQTLETAWASREEYRPRVSPQIAVSTVAHLPTETETLVDTLAFIRDSGGWWRAETDGRGGITWMRQENVRTVDFQFMGGWMMDSATGGIICQHTREGKTFYTAEISLTRDTSDFSFGTNWFNIGTFLPPNVRSDALPVNRLTRLATSPAPVEVTLEPSTGKILVRTLSGTQTWKKSAELRFNASWVR